MCVPLTITGQKQTHPLLSVQFQDTRTRARSPPHSTQTYPLPSATEHRGPHTPFTYKSKNLLLSVQFQDTRTRALSPPHSTQTYPLPSAIDKQRGPRTQKKKAKARRSPSECPRPMPVWNVITSNLHQAHARHGQRPDTAWAQLLKSGRAFTPHLS